MEKIIDAKGLSCPKPVMLAKKALDTQDEITIVVDNQTAAENVKMFAKSKGCEVDIIKEGESIYYIHIKNNRTKIKCTDMIDSNEKGPTVFVISSNIMGNGDEKLGQLLVKGFIHATTELDRLPDIMIFYNTGVKLLTIESDIAEDIIALGKKGVKVLACGTCANYFEIGEKITAGTIGNMYDIVSILATSGRIVTI
jgi:selenium metabolism protein YedF